MSQNRFPATAVIVLLLLGTAAMLALNLPGQMSYDSVSQLYQGRAGFYNSWHPPVMAWLLGSFDRVWPGPALFVIFDAALLLGAWCMLLRLGRPGWGALAVSVLLLLTPQFLLYQGTVWKDVLFADGAVAAFAALALAAARWTVARGRWLALAALLLTLAALTRQNGIVLLPVAAVTLGWIAARRAGWRQGLYHGAGALLILGLLAGAALSALSLRGDDGDGARAEIRAAQSFDLIGALKLAPDLKLAALDRDDPELARLLRSPGVALYTPTEIDPVAASPKISDAISDVPDALLFAQWEDLVFRHPGLYLRDRWPVFRWTVATPDIALCHPAFAGIEGAPEQLHVLGLTARIRPQDKALAAYARAWMGTPILSHLTFLALDALLLTALLRRRREADLAIAGLLAGALLFTASFFVISLACDYRYLDFLDLAALSALFYWSLSREKI